MLGGTKGDIPVPLAPSVPLRHAAWESNIPEGWLGGHSWGAVGPLEKAHEHTGVCTRVLMSVALLPHMCKVKPARHPRLAFGSGGGLV